MREIFLALRFADNTFQRVILAIAATLYAIATAIGPNLEGSRTAQAYQALVLASGYKWAFAGLFAFNAACLWWRLFDHTARLYFAFAINLFTATLWITITAATLVVYQGFLPDAVCEIMISVIALFTLVRTDKTHSDVETA